MATSYNTRTALENAIYSWLYLVLTPEGETTPPVKLIWANQNGVQPTGSFLALNLTVANIMEGARDAMRFNVGVDEERISDGRRLCTLSVNAFGQDASDALWDLKQLLECEISDSALDSANLSLIEHTDIQDVSELLETKFQKRCQMDMRIGYTTEKVSGSGNTERVVIDDGINGETITVDVP